MIAQSDIRIWYNFELKSDLLSFQPKSFQPTFISTHITIIQMSLSVRLVTSPNFNSSDKVKTSSIQLPIK